MGDKNKKKKIPAADLGEIIPLLIGAWRKIHRESGPKDRLQTREFRSAVAALTALNERLSGQQQPISNDWPCDPHLWGAYLLYYWVIHYQEGLSLLNELPKTPQRVLDIGSGAGPYALAALKHGANDVVATDSNRDALQLASALAGQCGYPLTIRQWNCLRSHIPIEGKFDLIISAHCIEEIFPSQRENWLEQRALFFEGMMMERLTPGGFLLVVESSHAEVNRRQLMLRDALRARGVPVQAPCIWQGSCPALASGALCYAQRDMDKPFLIKELQRAAKINLGSLKMSYTLFRHPQASLPETPLKRLYRVISPPIDLFRGKRYYLCGVDGKKSLGSYVNVHEKNTRAFEYLRRGDAIALENISEQRDLLDIRADSTLTLYAPCDKPLPHLLEKEDIME